jgi:hypothetical protein
MFCFSCENYLAAFLDPTLTDARVSVVYWWVQNASEGSSVSQWMGAPVVC